MAQDKELTCRECKAPFTFSASEQEFFAEKGFTNEPVRCPTCRAARKQSAGGRDRGNDRQREMHEVTCSECGKQTEVPFRPSGDRPVYCRDCFSQGDRRN